MLQAAWMCRDQDPSNRVEWLIYKNDEDIENSISQLWHCSGWCEAKRAKTLLSSIFLPLSLQYCAKNDCSRNAGKETGERLLYGCFPQMKEEYYTGQYKIINVFATFDHSQWLVVHMPLVRRVEMSRRVLQWKQVTDLSMSALSVCHFEGYLFWLQE